MERDKKTGLLIFSASDLMKFMESPFHTWMDRYKLEFPDSEKAKLKDSDDEMKTHLRNEGALYEEEVIKKIQSDSSIKSEMIESSISKSSRYKKTLESMKKGVDVIFQPRLEKENFAGYADILYKKKGKSKLGEYYYAPWDVKLSHSIKAKYAIQLCCYAEMLESIQGEISEIKGGLILGDDSKHELRVADYKYYYQNLKQAFLKQQQEFNPDITPDPSKFAFHGEWSKYAKMLLEESDHLSQVARITKNQIKILESNDINTMTKLAELERKSLPKMRNEILERLKDQAQLQIKSKNKIIPEYRALHPDPSYPRTGLALLPPHSKNDIFFDMEGYPHIKGGLEYLFGSCIYSKNKKDEVLFKTIWAHNPEEEKKAFEQFIDWVYKLWKEDPEMHIYHYGNYEKAALSKLMHKYGTREEKLGELYAHNAFIDLYEVVRNGIRIGEPHYSIKNVEHLYRSKRENDVKDAATSIVYYGRWLKIKDEDKSLANQILKDIEDYNLDDCKSTQELAVFLRNLQQKEKIRWVGNLILQDEDKKDQKIKKFLNSTTLLREKILKTHQGEEEMETLAWVLEFQAREQRPKNWLLFQRLNMTDVELYEDADCLASVKLKKPDDETKDYVTYEGKFDPNQESKLKEGDNCYIQGNYEFNLNKLIQVKIISIDTEKGKLTLRGKKGLSGEVNLIPHDFFPPSPIREAILDVVESIDQKKPKSNALMDFLYHRPPKIKGNNKDKIIDPEKDLLKELVKLVKNMQSTTLTIQGPPGAGKTYSSAVVILSLIASGKKVGITSNSHKAIINLINKVIELQKKEPLKILRANSNYEEIDENSFVTWVERNPEAIPLVSEHNLICGTAWLFSNSQMTEKGNKLDYLFVDEAGQVSIAYLVGMSRSTDNIVLMGDQQQLEQPTQGVHPGKSGLSCLQYFLQGKATIPDDMGVFLPETWRMHPDVNEVISEMVYENKLKTVGHTKNRVVKTEGADVHYIKKESGVIFISEDHYGNSQTSSEEIRVIKKIVNELIGRKLTDKNGNLTRVIREEDILIVAPYNLQVNNLRKALGPKFRIASVDKFQGQEAPISIVSMCTSTFEESGSRRGLDFVLSTNRLNVAISRAESLSIVVGTKELAITPVKTIDDMKLVNFYCRIILNEENV